MDSATIRPQPTSRASWARNGRGRAAFGLAVLLCIVGAAAAAAVGDDIDRQVADARARIEAEGLCWEADDAFLRSLTPEERDALHGGFRMTEEDWRVWKDRVKVFPAEKVLPTVFDWRAQDGVTSIKNQGNCGSCWAFAGLASVESFVKIYYGEDLDLSEQQIISCNPYGSGCGGGWAGAVYNVLMTYGGIEESCMPYAGALADQVPCTQTEYLPYARLTGWHSVANDVTQIKTALMQGPVASAMDAEGEFETYSGGCYEGGTPWTNHLVLIIGWDDRMCNQQGAWICKNSWGTAFGMGGYFYIKYGASGIGSGVTQPEYTPPPLHYQITSPLEADVLIGDTPASVTWITHGGATGSVDIHFSSEDRCFELLVADGVPDNGSYLWMVPNIATTHGQLLIHPHDNIHAGYGFNPQPLTIYGHKVRYVSAAGSNTPPFETVATAAHTITQAVLASAGYDSVMVAGGEYLESVSVGGTVRLFGGWNTSFSQRDPALYPTRLRGLSSALRFWSTSGDFGGVDGFHFFDCQGTLFDQPFSGTHGGAILAVGCSPTIRACRFENNRAAPVGAQGLGGAILAIGGQPLIEDCLFIGNRADKGGAVALHQPEHATLRRNVFSGNSTVSTVEGSVGGGLYVCGGSISLEDDQFSQHLDVFEGAAVFGEGTAMTATGVRLADNRAVQRGGGLLARGGGLTMHGGVVTGNEAGSGGGGGVAVESSPAVLRNLRAAGNTTTGLGGGVMLAGVTTGVVENCLMQGNASGSLGGGMFATASGTFAVRNNIVLENLGNGLCGGGVGVQLDHNDVWNNVGGDYVGVAPGPHDLSADPRFVDALGGDFGLGLHSPCLDRGDPDPACADPDGSRADIGPRGGPDGGSDAPAAVTGAVLTNLGGGRWRVSWTANQEPDVAQYVVYRDTAAVFVPGPSKSAATLTHPTSEWIDEAAPGGAYYLVVAVDVEGHVGGYSDLLRTTITGVPGSGVPVTFAIAAIAPNPFNPRTTVWFDVPRATAATLAVHDLRGRLVRTLAHGDWAPGRHRAEWDGRDERGEGSAAGVYFVRLATRDGEARTLKVTLAK